jgi:transposase
MNHLTERERIEILMITGYGDRKRSHQEACALFNETHPNRNPISKSTVTKTLKRFNETGSVTNRLKVGRPRICTNEENSFNILLDVVENPKTSVLQAALNILKRAKYHPYKIHLVHELNEDDFDRRLQFCEVMMPMISDNDHFVERIVFSVEARLQLNGVVNRHNCRYWSDSNPHWMAAVYT